MATRCILDFVHPDEVDNARRDLKQVLQCKEGTGSVTRYVSTTTYPYDLVALYSAQTSVECDSDIPFFQSVRFLRLSAIRTALGASRSELAQWKDQERIAFDSNYLAADLVINWVADGLVLCFIHAIVGEFAVLRLASLVRLPSTFLQIFSPFTARLVLSVLASPMPLSFLVVTASGHRDPEFAGKGPCTSIGALCWVLGGKHLDKQAALPQWLAHLVIIPGITPSR